MTRLTCTAGHCVYNEGGFCGAEFIKVNGDGVNSPQEAKCETYELDTLGNEIKSLVNTNFSDGIMQIFSLDNDVRINPTVMCDISNCFYNGGGKCEALDIMIYNMDENSENRPYCQTFSSAY